MNEIEQQATIDPPRAIRIKTSTGWADLALAGPGVPPGGAAGNILTKTSPTDFSTAWQPPAPSGADLEYNGTYDPAKVYDDGDFVVDANGITYCCVMDGTVGIAPTPWNSGQWGVPQPPVAGQWLKGSSGGAVWAPIMHGDILDGITAKNGSNQVRFDWSAGVMECWIDGVMVQRIPQGPADTAWRIIGAAGQPPFENGYAQWDSQRVPRFRRLANGAVMFGGILRTPANPALTAFTLPVGYRPAASLGDLTFWVNATQQPSLCNINAAGQVYLTAAASPLNPVPVNSWCYIDGVQFYAES